MKKIALIPARYAATRFPAKLMQILGDKSVIRHTYDATVATGLFDAVVVVTDSDIIYNEIIGHRGIAIKSNGNHESGTDRIAEALPYFPDAEIIVNVQGDEPFTQTEPLKKLLDVFENDKNKEVLIASPMQFITDKSRIDDENVVKVVVDKLNNALLFSRSRIPFNRDKSIETNYFSHIGIYAFRRETLVKFTQLPIGILEATEKIECLRFLENGIPIKMVLTDYNNVQIDTPEDLERAKAMLH